MADSGVSKDLFPPGIHMNCRRSDHKWSAKTRCCFYLLLTCVSCDHSLIRFRERASKTEMNATDRLFKKLLKIHCALKTRHRVLNSRQASCKENSTLIRTIMVIYRTICFSQCFVSLKYAVFPRSGQNIIQNK